jgi:hypothetical protein
MLNYIVFAIFISVFIFTLLKSFQLYIKLDNLQTKLLQAHIDKNIILEKTKIENTDSFLRFVEQSRQDAFKYIEEVQKSLTKFISDIEPEINHFKEYSDLMSMAPNYYSMKKITSAYEELRKLLPEEYGKIDT